MSPTSPPLDSNPALANTAIPAPVARVARPAPARRGWRRLLIALCALVLLWIMFLAWALLHVFWVSSDLRALRNTLVKSEPAWRKTIELRIGPALTSLARFSLSHVDLDQEARLALSAIRSVEGGIYHWTSRTPLPEASAMIRNADAVMTSRGWERWATVLKGSSRVVLFGRKDDLSTHNVPVCVLVAQKRNLIIISGRADLEPLWTLVEGELEL